MNLPVTTFAFNKFSAWHTFAFAIIGFTIFLAIIGFNFSLGSIFLTVLSVGLFTYFIKTIFIPTVNGKSALTLTQESIFIGKTNKTIYWKDVSRLYLRYFPFRRSYFIVIELLSSKEEIILNTGFFSDEIHVIERTLQEYLKILNH